MQNKITHWLFSKASMTFFICLLSVSFLAAQTVSGELKDSDGEPLIGASVVVQGTNSGTITDIDGRYSINASPGDVLLISYIGYRDQTITVGDDANISLMMESDSEILDEVVVVGYGTRKKSHNTGAIAQIGGPEIAAIQSNRVDDALAGKLAGVLIQNQDGAPGADPKIQVRAANSISGESQPLVVVDGYPISGSIATVNPNDIQSLEVLKDAASSAIYGSRGANGVILITTKKGTAGKPQLSYNAYVSTSHRYRNDVDQLKTAGEWAGILEAGIADGTYDVSDVDPRLVDYRINAFKNAPDVVAVEDWLFESGSSTAHDLSVSGGNEDASYFASVGYLNTDGIVRTQGFERFNARLNVDANLGKRFKTGLSVNGFYGNRDIVGTDMRDLLRAYSIHPIYHTEESIQFVKDLDAERQRLSDEGVLVPILLGNPAADSLRFSNNFDNGYRGPDDAPFNSSIDDLEPGMTAQDWHYGRDQNGIGGSGDAGPATKLDNTDRYQKTLFANVNTYLNFEIADGLNLRTVLGGDIRDQEDFRFQGREFDSRARSTQSALTQTNVKNQSVLSETTLGYNKIIGGVHDLSAVVGIEFQTFFNKGVALTGTNLPFDLPANFGLLSGVQISERRETIARRSQFGRVNYAYDNRYLISASIRRDGDSRFGENERFAVFPAVSVGWNVHNEAFYNSDFLSDIKLRASYGQLGTTSFLGAYNSLALLNPGQTVFGTGFLRPNDVANPNLTWQTNTEANFGISLGFLQNRFTLSADYYTSDIDDILINQSVSEITGTTSVALNSGDVESSGFELELGANIINNRDMRWSVAGNFSTVDNEIVSLNGLDQLPNVQYGQSGRGPIFRNRVGGEIGEMWGLETTGMVETQNMIDPTRSIGISSSAYYVVDQLTVDTDGDGIPDEADGVIDFTKGVDEGGDLIKVGQNTPDYYYGFSSSFAFKDFDVSVQFQGAQGGDVFNVDEIYWRSEFGGRLKLDFDAIDNATGLPLEGGDGIADDSGLFYEQSRNQLDAQIQDASYLALRNFTIGYSINSDWTNNIGVSGLRIYAAATNLLYIFGDNYTSLNPEGVETTNGGYLGPTTYGVQVGASPVVRSFTFGLNVNF